MLTTRFLVRVFLSRHLLFFLSLTGLRPDDDDDDDDDDDSMRLKSLRSSSSIALCALCRRRRRLDHRRLGFYDDGLSF